MRRYLLFGILALVLTACPPPCEMVYLDYGTLSDEVLAMLPYEDGSSHGFMHSGGLEISFFTDRKTSMTTDFWDECIQITYGSDNTLMTADYPVFDITFRIYKTDAESVVHQASIGTSSYGIPLTADYNPDYFSVLDSFFLDGKWYLDVYELVPWYNPYQTQDDILADTMWYNTDFGILKFTMTNGEFFKIIP